MIRIALVVLLAGVVAGCAFLRRVDKYVQTVAASDMQQPPYGDQK
jgi:hypothetical protein